jgi:hypothetical protein
MGEDRDKLVDALLQLRGGLYDLRRLFETGLPDTDLSIPPDKPEQKRRPARRRKIRERRDLTFESAPPVAENVDEEDVSYEGLAVTRDEFYLEAVRIITEFGHASVSLLGLWLAIGSARAERLLHELESDGLIVPGRAAHEYRVLPKAYAIREDFDRSPQFATAGHAVGTR